MAPIVQQPPDPMRPAPDSPEEKQLSLGTKAARNLTTTTKSAPQMQGITSRWLLRMLPWVETKGGAYRVNRRLTFRIGDGRIEFTNVGGAISVIPEELRELPMLHDLDDDAVLRALADRFAQREYGAGDPIVEAGEPADRIILIAHGKADKLRSGKYGDDTVIGVLADGDRISYLEQSGAEAPDIEEHWDYAVRCQTRCLVLELSRADFEAVMSQSPSLAEAMDRFWELKRNPQNRYGEADIPLASGHAGEPTLPGTFVDYELSPREYELSVAQTVLRVHTRVADLFNEPMDQTEHQLRLTIEALRRSLSSPVRRFAFEITERRRPPLAC